MNWEQQLEQLGGAATLRQLHKAGATEPMLTALRSGARLSCVTAARTYGLRAGVDERTHLVLPPNAGRAGGAALSHVRHWRRCDSHPEVWRVSLADCLRTVARCADPETARAVLDTSMSSGQTAVSGLRWIFAGEPRKSRAELMLAGGRLLRFPARQIIADPEAVARTVEAALGLLEEEVGRRVSAA